MFARLAASSRIYEKEGFLGIDFEETLPVDFYKHVEVNLPWPFADLDLGEYGVIARKQVKRKGKFVAAKGVKPIKRTIEIRDWLLVGVAKFDLVAAITGSTFGETNMLSTIVYLAKRHTYTLVRPLTGRWFSCSGLTASTTCE